MTTYGEAFLVDLENALAALHSFSHNPYDGDNVRDVLSSVGTKSELFLRSVVLPGESPKKTSEHLIDALPMTWVSPIQRDALHRLRRLYNKAKHDPRYQVDLLDALDVISQATVVYQHLVARGAGLTCDERPSNFAPGVLDLSR